MNYVYNYHGLTLSSDCSFPELLEVETSTKVDICLLETSLDSIHKRYSKFIVNGIATLDGALYFNIKGIGRFHFIDKTKVHFQLDSDTTWHQARPYVYSNVLTTLLQMHNRFTLHGSAIVKDKQLVLFCGKSGAGKSTLISQLLGKGFDIFCDDRLVISYGATSDQLVGYSGTSLLRLHGDSISHLSRRDDIGPGNKVEYKKDKWEFDLSDKITRGKFPLERIYVLQRAKVDKLQQWQVCGHQKMTILSHQSFKSQFIQYIGKEKEHFEFLSKVVAKIPMEVIRRPLEMKIPDFSQYIANILDQ